jgi:gliding motility-associated-like protein
MRISLLVLLFLQCFDGRGFSIENNYFRLSEITYQEPLTVPNAFTPNGDNINDTWKPRFTDSIETIQVSVYNQYGELVFESKEIYFEWDGRNKKGKPHEQGRYIFIIEYYYKGSLRTLKGSLLLFR